MRKRISKLVLKRETIADLNQLGKVAGGNTLGVMTCLCSAGGGTADTTFGGGTASQGQSCAVSGCTQPH